MATGTAILVVDDDPIFLDVLTTRLRAAGYEVAAAKTGSEALSLCLRLRVDLVIADWIMPGMDGVELCRALKADPTLRQIYCILLTAREGVADKVTALDSGADEYVVKPCAEEEILARVRAGLRIRRLQDELAHMEWRLATRELAAALGQVINNPLAAIANYLELLDLGMRNGGGEPVRDILDGAHREVDRIAKIIRRLVNLRDPQRIPTTLGADMTDLGNQP
jgi:sigma-B regulation protein RsbU (phosphoserine phosphatase)